MGDDSPNLHLYHLTIIITAVSSLCIVGLVCIAILSPIFCAQRKYYKRKLSKQTRQETLHNRNRALQTTESDQHSIVDEPHVPPAPLLATESSTTPNSTGHRLATSDTTNVVRGQENTAPHVVLGEAQASPSSVLDCEREHWRLGNVYRISRTSYPDSAGSTVSIPSGKSLMYGIVYVML